MIRRFQHLCLLLGALLMLVGGASNAAAETATRVFLNGIPTPVYFNDGDSFRVLAGKLKGSKARLAGFNTLESYGPVHQWGTWSRHELSRYASLGTLNARKGVWRCTSDMDKDVYGRILWDCPDLAVDQVHKGLAHAMTVTEDPADARLLVAQADAIANRRGMWAHGAPDFVLTSLHSTTENWGDKKPYNRQVSSKDGHSWKFLHDHAIAECQSMCTPAKDPNAETIRAKAAALLADPALQAGLEGLTVESLADLITGFVTGGILGKLPKEDTRYTLETALTRAISEGSLSESDKPASCMVYVAFKRRYGATRAKCLR
jgi:endonuclease YncB( thermonuclease family)